MSMEGLLPGEEPYFGLSVEVKNVQEIDNVNVGISKLHRNYIPVLNGGKITSDGPIAVLHFSKDDLLPGETFLNENELSDLYDTIRKYKGNSETIPSFGRCGTSKNMNNSEGNGDATKFSSKSMRYMRSQKGKNHNENSTICRDSNVTIRGKENSQLDISSVMIKNSSFEAIKDNVNHVPTPNEPRAILSTKKNAETDKNKVLNARKGDLQMKEKQNQEDTSNISLRRKKIEKPSSDDQVAINEKNESSRPSDVNKCTVVSKRLRDAPRINYNEKNRRCHSPNCDEDDIKPKKVHLSKVTNTEKNERMTKLQGRCRSPNCDEDDIKPKKVRLSKVTNTEKNERMTKLQGRCRSPNCDEDDIKPKKVRLSKVTNTEKKERTTKLKGRCRSPNCNEDDIKPKKVRLSKVTNTEKKKRTTKLKEPYISSNFNEDDISPKKARLPKVTNPEKNTRTTTLKAPTTSRRRTLYSPSRFERTQEIMELFKDEVD